jgi:catalase-peroxidase
MAAEHGGWGHVDRDWWPNQLNLQILHQNSAKSNPMGEDFNYAEEFKKLDLDAVKKDINELMTTSQDWWPADYGHYGPLFIRMAWHSAGTYRVSDGRGGAATAHNALRRSTVGPTTRTSTRPVGCSGRSSRSTANKISWADLMVLAGNVRPGVDGIQDVRLRGRSRGRLGAATRRLLGA